MPNVLNNEKIELIAQNYAATKFMNKSQALINTGYSESYAKHGGLKIFDNIRLKTAIERIKAENKAKFELTVEKLTEDTIKFRDEAHANKYWPAVVSFQEQLHKISGSYAADNEQKHENRELNELQKQDIEDYKAWKRRQLIKRA